MAHADIEGTISRVVQRMGLRRLRYTGPSRTHLQHVAMAAAFKAVRVVNKQSGDHLEGILKLLYQALIAA